ncbi:MAG: hypothetical protein IPL27_11055 [Lewinellaceae bacterium]|nr:hypothetical protein [Lewinellaceae bacterium]
MKIVCLLMRCAFSSRLQLGRCSTLKTSCSYANIIVQRNAIRSISQNACSQISTEAEDQH